MQWKKFTKKIVFKRSCCGVKKLCYQPQFFIYLLNLETAHCSGALNTLNSSQPCLEPTSSSEIYWIYEEFEKGDRIDDFSLVSRRYQHNYVQNCAKSLTG